MSRLILNINKLFQWGIFLREIKFGQRTLNKKNSPFLVCLGQRTLIKQNRSGSRVKPRGGRKAELFGILKGSCLETVPFRVIRRRRKIMKSGRFVLLSATCLQIFKSLDKS